MKLQLFLCLAATSAAAQRVCVLPFEGPKATAVRSQVVSALCDSADCVPTSSATKGGKMDWKKAKKEAVVEYVGGKVLKKGKQLELSVYTKPGKPTVKKVFPLVKGALSGKSLNAAVDLLKASVKGSASASKPSADDAEAGEEDPDAKPKAAVVTAPPEPKQPETRVDKRPAVTETESPSSTRNNRDDDDSDDRSDNVKKASGSQKRRPFLVFDIGNDLLNRQFTYRNLTTNNLREYAVTLYSLPGIKAQFYPFALGTPQGALAGLGIEGALHFMPFLTTTDPTDATVKYQTQSARVDAGLTFRIVPTDAIDFGIAPFVGIRLQNYLVGFNANKDRVLGLPNVFETGLRAGLALDVNLADGAFSVFGKGAFIPLLGFGEIGRAPYFPNRNGYGLDFELGLGVRIFGPASIRASFLYTRYRLTFTDIPENAVYFANGAADQYLGGNISLRLQF